MSQRQYSFTPRFQATRTNPHDEGSKLWHVWIDLHCCYNGDSNDVVSLQTLATYTDLGLEYYVDPLEQLTTQGYLARIDGAE